MDWRCTTPRTVIIGREKTIGLTDHPADNWFGVTADGKGCVTQLVLEWNQLSGTIPPELGNLAKLIVLNLGGNYLSGCVPSSLQGQLDRLDTDLSGLPFS